MTDVLNKIEEPAWCHIFEEDGYNREAVINAGFKKIGTKVSTFSDIIGVYYKGGRKFIPVPETENIQYIDGVKIGVLAGSLLSTLFGYFILLFSTKN